MDQYVTGEAIRTLREKAGFTQAELASKICVSDKTVSKWETGKGYPDISLLEPLSEALHVSITELLSGNLITNNNVSANMLRSKFYVCPVCGNIIHGTGESVVQCNGVTLVPEELAKPDDKHFIRVERVDDEYFVSVDHEMTKQHYISFIAAVSDDGIQLKKIYPESAAEARFRIEGVRKFYCYCNRDGLFGL